MSTKQLMKRYSLMGSKDLSDELYAIAYNIEQSLLSAGAIPGKDYTYLDLYHLSNPFVLEMFRNEGRIEYMYPADKVASP